MLYGRRDDNESDIIKALRQVGASVYQLSGAGIPDLLVGWCQRMFLLEVKSATGKLTPKQIEFRHAWKGPQPATVRTVAEALRTVGVFGTHG